MSTCDACGRTEGGPKLEVLSLRAQNKSSNRPPLLFVHGGWHDAHCWNEYFMPYFASLGYDCHAVSLRGHGASEGKERMRRHRLDDFVHDVCSVASALPKPPVIIAHSLGGCITAHYLARHRVPAAILLTPVPPNGLWSVTWRFIARHPLRFMLVNLTMRGVYLVNQVSLARDFLFSDAMPDEDVKRYMMHIDDESYFGYVDTLVRRTPPPPPSKIDVLIVAAEHDRLIGPKDHARTVAHFGADRVEVPGIAHDVMLEPAWLSVAEIVRDRLARVVG